MDDLAQKLSAVMNDPAMMEQIMALAKSMDGGSETPEPPEDTGASPMPEVDMALLKKLSSLAGKGQIDKNQQNLLHALAPYLSNSRINRLERAMKAAKMAGIATAMIGR